MPRTEAFRASPDQVLQDLFCEWVFSTFFLSAEIVTLLPERLVMLLDPVNDIVTAILVQGDLLAIGLPFLLVLAPLTEVLLKLIIVRFSTPLVEFIRDAIEERPSYVNLSEHSVA